MEEKYKIQQFEYIEASALLDKAGDLLADGYRLAQACGIPEGDHFDIMYTFDKDHVLTNIKIAVPKTGASLPSITKIYWAAFIYEKEIHDLFGVEFKHSELDYGGHFFKLSQPTPWNPPEEA